MSRKRQKADFLLFFVILVYCRNDRKPVPLQIFPPLLLRENGQVRKNKYLLSFVSNYFCTFAFKYCRCVVNGKAAAQSLSAGWRYYFSGNITSVCCYSEKLQESSTFDKDKTERISCKRLCEMHGRDLSGFVGACQSL